jgi:hypothetical protein
MSVLQSLILTFKVHASELVVWIRGFLDLALLAWKRLLMEENLFVQALNLEDGI